MLTLRTHIMIFGGMNGKWLQKISSGNEPRVEGENQFVIFNP